METIFLYAEDHTGPLSLIPKENYASGDGFSVNCEVKLIVNHGGYEA